MQATSTRAAVPLLLVALLICNVAYATTDESSATAIPPKCLAALVRDLSNFGSVGDITATTAAVNAFVQCGQLATNTLRPIRLLVPNTLDPFIQQLALLYQKATGYAVEFTFVDTQAIASEVAFTLSNNVTLLHDGWIIDPTSLSVIASKKALQPLDAYIASDMALSWPDVHPFFRQVSSVYESHIVGVPLTGEVSVMYYRRDIFAASNLSIPETWDDVLDVAAALNGTDFDGDGQGDYALCFQIFNQCLEGGVVLGQILAPLTQYKGTSQGWLFDPKDLSSFVSGPAMSHALGIFQHLTPYTWPDGVCNVVNLRLQSGQCALTIKWSEAFKAIEIAAPALRGKLGTSLLPGHTQVYQRDDPLPSVQGSGPTDEASKQPAAAPGLTACDTMLCPLATKVQSPTGIRVVNRSPYFGFGSFAGTVNALGDKGYQAATYGFYSFISSGELGWSVLLADNPVGPFRLLQLHASSISRWQAAGYDPTDTAVLLSVLSATLGCPNIALDLRLPGSASFVATLNNMAYIASLGQQAIPDIMSAAASAFNATIKEQGGTRVVLAGFRASLAGTSPLYSLDPTPEGRSHLSRAARAFAIAGSVLGLAAIVVMVLVAVRQKWSARRLFGFLPAPGAGPETTLLVTDIEGSTSLWETQDEWVMDRVIKIHHDVFRSLLPKHDGYESQTEGDSFILAFHKPQCALKFALAVQQALMLCDWPSNLLEVEACRPLWALQAQPAGAGKAGRGKSLVIPALGSFDELSRYAPSPWATVAGGPEWNSIRPRRSFSCPIRYLGCLGGPSPSPTAQAVRRLPAKLRAISADGGGGCGGGGSGDGIGEGRPACVGGGGGGGFAQGPQQPVAESLEDSLDARPFQLDGCVTAGTPGLREWRMAASGLGSVLLPSAIADASESQEGGPALCIAGPQYNGGSSGSRRTWLHSLWLLSIGSPLGSHDRASRRLGPVGALLFATAACWRRPQRWRRGQPRMAVPAHGGVGGSHHGGMAGVVASMAGSVASLEATMSSLTMEGHLAGHSPIFHSTSSTETFTASTYFKRAWRAEDRSTPQFTLNNESSFAEGSDPRQASGYTATHHDRPSGAIFGGGNEQAGGAAVASGTRVLVFRGLRVRMGMSCGFEAADVVHNKTTSRMQYIGETAALTRAVADAAQGGMILLSEAAFERTACLATVREVCLILNAGEHLLKDRLLPPSVLYQALAVQLLQRSAFLGPPRTRRQVQLGLGEAPLGRVAVAFMNVIGISTLMAWDKEVTSSALQLYHGVAVAHLQLFGGYLVELSDGLCLATFLKADAAVEWACTVKEALKRASWSDQLLSHELCESMSVEAPQLAGLPDGRFPSRVSQDQAPQGSLPSAATPPSTGRPPGGVPCQRPASEAEDDDDHIPEWSSPSLILNTRPPALAADAFPPATAPQPCPAPGPAGTAPDEATVANPSGGAGERRPDSYLRISEQHIRGAVVHPSAGAPLEPHELMDGRATAGSAVPSQWAASSFQTVLLFRGLRLKAGIDMGQAKAEVNSLTGRMTYRGRVMNRAARITERAQTGQVVCSAAVWEVCDMAGTCGLLGRAATGGTAACDGQQVGHQLLGKFLGEHVLKGVPEPVLLYSCQLVDAASMAPGPAPAPHNVCPSSDSTAVPHMSCEIRGGHGDDDSGSSMGGVVWRVGAGKTATCASGSSGTPSTVHPQPRPYSSCGGMARHSGSSGPSLLAPLPAGSRAAGGGSRGGAGSSSNSTRGGAGHPGSPRSVAFCGDLLAAPGTRVDVQGSRPATQPMVLQEHSRSSTTVASVCVSSGISVDAVVLDLPLATAAAAADSTLNGEANAQ